MYDFTSFVSKSVNPNLRGLGHTGWGETGNPTHVIRFRWNDQSEKTEMYYKLDESDETWKPQLIFDPELKSWRPPANDEQPPFYEVLSTEHTEQLLLSAPAVVVQGKHPSALKDSIFRCGTKFEGTI